MTLPDEASEAAESAYGRREVPVFRGDQNHDGASGGGQGKGFNVYSHPVKGYECVKDGFSWPALFFGFFWMLAKRLWSKALLFAALGVGASVLEVALDSAPEAETATGLSYLVLAAVWLAIALVPALKGNGWRSQNLRMRGYELISHVRAQSPDAALAIVARK